MDKQELLNTKLDGVIIAHKMSVKIDETGTGKNDPRYDLSINFDYTGWTVGDVLRTLANPSVTITFAGMLRKQNAEYVKGQNGKTVLVSNAGKSPKAQIDVQAAFMAKFTNASPEEQAKMIEELQAKVKQA